MSGILGGLIGSYVSVTTSSFESIATVTLSATGNVEFTSIPQTYKSLQIRYIARGDSAATQSQVRLRVNNNTLANYVYHEFSANGDNASIVASGSALTTAAMNLGYITASSSAANMFGTGIIDIVDYTSTTKNKTVRSFSGHQQGSGTTTLQKLALSSGLWLPTTAVAITSLLLYQTTGSGFVAGSTFALYGIRG